MLHGLQRLWTGFYVAVLLFVCALVLATFVQTSTPGCSTCGAHLALTLWMIAVAGHQPVLWAGGLTCRRRFGIFVLATLLGLIAYGGLEAVGFNLTMAGRTAIGLELGLAADPIAVGLALVSSLMFVRLPAVCDVALKVGSSLALLWAAALASSALYETGVLETNTGALLAMMALWLPTLILVWASPEWRAEFCQRLGSWLRSDRRLLPFYLAALLVSIAALRYILAD